MPDKIALTGSGRFAPRNATPLGARVNPQTHAEVTLTLRRRFPDAWRDFLHDHGQCRASRAGHHHLDEGALRGLFGATADDVQTVSHWADTQGLHPGEVDPSRRTLKILGTLEALTRAFGTEPLTLWQTPQGRVFRARKGALHLPTHLQGIVTGVFGLDDRPTAKPHFRQAKEGGNAKAAAVPYAAAHVTPTSYDPREIAKSYKFTEKTGAGECVALIELGGGYNPDTLQAYFQKQGLTPLPIVQDVSIDGGANSPGEDADYEVQLDIEIVALCAPGAKIKVYFAPNTDQGFLDAILAAVHDPEVTLGSISWGSPSALWTPQALRVYNAAFADAAALGKPFFVASGDDGSDDGQNDGKPHVDFPAASPYAFACGGTTLPQSGSEIAWNESQSGGGATGGGVSGYFARPAYQKLAGVPKSDQKWGGRGVPDASGNADPQTGYRIEVNGQSITLGGTSAVSPLYAALFARLNEALRSAGKPRAGFLQPLLYAHPQAFTDVTQGNNGPFYHCAKGWDPVTGLGSPQGDKILQALLS
jgi:kumamolisin